MSLVLAADYRVPDFDHWCAALSGDLAGLPGLGAHHVVVYRSLQDASRVFVTIGVRERGPVDALLRSPVMFSWFDSAGVDEIPPMFAGEIVEKLDLTPETQEASPAAGGPAVGVPAAGGPAAAGAVIVAAIAAVGRLDRLRASVHAAVPRLTASGMRRFWIYRALDNQAEVMVLQEIATERQADQWIRHPDAAASFMAEAGGRVPAAVRRPPGPGHRAARDLRCTSVSASA